MSAPHLPTHMRAWQFTHTRGGIEKNLTLTTSALLPQPKASQDVIQVLSAALNPVDYKVAEVGLLNRLFIAHPATPANDIVGRVVAPSATSHFKPNDLVFGVSSVSPFAGGGLREYTVSGAEAVVPLPENVAPTHAATVGVAGLTAYQSLAPYVREGSRVLINGGSGGTGVFGIQIAKLLGCHVTATCSTGNVPLCESLGADVVVDYTDRRHGTSVVDALVRRGMWFDHVVDNVGSDEALFWRCHEFTPPAARIVMIAGSPSLAYAWLGLKMRLWPGWAGGGRRKAVKLFAQMRAEELERIGRWMSKGQLRAVVDSEFVMEEAREAFVRLKTGRARGKVVVHVEQKKGGGVVEDGVLKV